MVVEAFDVLNTILEISGQQLCHYCLKDELEEAGGAHGSQSDYNCRAAGDSHPRGAGGATSSCGHRHCVFPDSGRHFLRQTQDMIIMLVGKLI